GDHYAGTVAAAESRAFFRKSGSADGQVAPPQELLAVRLTVVRHVCLTAIFMANNPNLGKNSRLYLLGGILLFWCVAICGRLVYLQIFRYGTFVKQAEHQQQRAIPLSAKRGVIYDRAGKELAMSVLVDSAFAVPSEVKDLPTAV